MGISLDYFIQAVKLTLRSTNHCFFMTHAPDGNIHARLMEHFPPDSDLNLWFGTKTHSRKVSEIQQNNRVTVGFHGLDSRAYATVIGLAEAIDDPELKEKYWQKGWDQFYKKGPTADDYTLLRVYPMRIELVNHELGIVAPDLHSFKMPALVRLDDGQWAIETL